MPLPVARAAVSAAVDVPSTWTAGQSLTITGSGWVTQAGDAGSRIAVKLDDGAVTTTTVDPVTGAAMPTVYALVSADASGAWTAVIPFPTQPAANVTWKAGESHTVRFLSGSLVAGDVARSQVATVSVVATIPEPVPTRTPTLAPTTVPTATSTPTPSSVPTPSPGQAPPDWEHETVTVTDPVSGRTATAWVQRQVSAGGTIAIRGAGWLTASGTAPSTVALKLNGPDARQYTRAGDGIVAHPSAMGDDTIWALLAATNPSSHAHVEPVAADGSFDVTLDAPTGLAAGQYFAVQFQSGRFDSADVTRSVTTAPLVVGGVPYVDNGGGGSTVCVPGVASPTLTVSATGVRGGALRVQGAGWCHPTAGGSVLGVKLDEGGYSRLDTSVHQNRTIWAVIRASDTDGSFDVELTLPDGSTSGADGSVPAFAEGGHRLRVLTGSLKAGDAVRSVLSDEFVVGAYQPVGAPDPVEAGEDLSAASAGGMTVQYLDGQAVVGLPGVPAGTWVYLNLFDGGVPRAPWRDTWFRTAADGTVAAPLAGITPRTYQVSAQSGDLGDVGRLLGWATLVVPASVTPPTPSETTSDTATPGATGSDTTSGSASTATSASAVVGKAATKAATALTAPTTVPAAPVSRGSQLSDDQTGQMTATVSGTVAALTIPGAQSSQFAYLFVYTGATVSQVGWVHLDADRRVDVDLASLGDGRHRIAAVLEDGTLLGWATAVVGVPVAEAVGTATTAQAQAGAELPPAVAAAADRPASRSMTILLGAAGVVLMGGAVTAFVLGRTRKVSA